MATAMDRGLRSSEHRDQIADSDIDEEDWDQEPHDLKETGTLELGSINWDDINDEVEAAMNESDDEDGDGDAKSERSHGIESEHASEEEWTDGDSILGLVLSIIHSFSSHLINVFVVRSAPNTPRSSSRKRPRSETPPALGGTVNGNTDDDLCSPLAKRKRLVSDSRLKQGITARDLAQPESETTSNASSSARGTPAAVVPPNDRHDMEQDEEGGNEDEEDDDDDDSTDSDDSSEEEKEEDDDDDFLARALEEDMG
jgi:RNA polymerase II subunit A-like phosphatase